MTETNELGRVEFLNPPELHRNPAFSQAVVVSGPVKTIYIGGQNAVDAAGNIVGKGDLRAQTVQILNNVKAALAAAGARPEHVVKWTIYVLQGQPLNEGFEAFQEVWGRPANPPVISGLFVAGLAHPDFLAEIEAVAVVADVH